MKKSRILFLITRSNAGGAQSHVLELLQGLRHKYDLILATGEEGFLLSSAKEVGIKTYLLQSLKRNISPLQDYRAYKEICAVIQDIQPDLIHTHSSKAGILGRLAAHNMGIKNVFTAHGWAFAEGTPLSRKMLGIPTEYIAAKWCNHIITVSHADKILAVKFHIVNEKKISVIHNGIADTKPVLLSKEDNQKPILIMVARIAPQKDFSGLLSALALIDQKYHLRIVGDGPDLKKIQNLAIELGIKNNIDFMGTRSDVADLLASSDIFILSSEWEGFPISIIEAMRCGLPIIASDVGGVSEAVIDEDNGYLIGRNNHEQLRLAILNLLKNKEKRKNMGKRSRALYEEAGTTEVMLEGIEKVYNELINEK